MDQGTLDKDNQIQRVEPARLLGITLISIFVSEVIAMVIIYLIPPLPFVWQTLIDAMIMTVLIFPVLYYLSFKPLLVHVREQQRVRSELLNAQSALELRVRERTLELSQANENLHMEIAERQRIADELKIALAASQQYQREISGLLDGTRAVLEYHNFADTARSIFLSCKTLVGATSGYISLVKEGFNEAVYLDSGEFPCSVAADVPMPIRGLRAQAYTSGEALIENNFMETEYASLLPAGHAPMDNVLFVPLKTEGSVVGLLGLGDKPGGFNPNDTRIASAFAELAAIALFNSRAEEELRKAHDELELRVQERTEALAQVNEELRVELAERALIDERLRLQATALETAANGIVITGKRGNVRWVNSAFTQMTGYSLEEVTGKNLRLLKSGQHASDFYNHLWETILSGQVWQGEMINRRKDGSLYPEEQTITPLRDEKGEISHFIAIKHDITERKQAEQALERSEGLLKKVLENLPVGVWITDASGTIMQGNPESKKIWAGARFVGIEDYGEYKGWWLESGAPIAPGEWAAARAVTNGETSINEEIEIECFDGTHKIILNSAVPILDAHSVMQGAIIVNQDITESKRAEKALQLERLKLRNILDTLPDGVYIVNQQYEIQYTNPVIAEEFGFVDGRKCHQYFHGLNEPCNWCKNQEVFSGKTVNWEWYSPKNNKIYDLFDTPFVNEDGSLSKLELFHDITERKRAEQTLINTSELLERYFNSIDVLIAYMDREFNFIRVNEAYARSAGHSVEHLSGKNHFDLYPHAENQVIFQRVVDTGEPYSVFEKAFEYPEFPERGVTYWDWSLQPVKAPDGVVEGLVLSLIDVTERKRAEIQLERQNQELRVLSEAERRQRQLAEDLAQSVIAVASSLQLEDVLSLILDQIRRAIPFRGANIALVEGENVRLVGYRGFEDLPDSLAVIQGSVELSRFPLFQQICTTHQPALISDTLENANWRIASGLEWVRSYLAVPLVSAGQVTGIISLTSDQPGAYDQEAVSKLMAFAAPAALALHNAHLYQAEQAARRVAETLRKAAQALTQNLDLDRVLHVLLEHIDNIIHPDAAGVALMQGETRLAARAVRIRNGISDAGQLLSIAVDYNSSPILQRLISTQESILIPDTSVSSEWLAVPEMEPYRCWLVMPLVTGDKVIGVVGLGKGEIEYFTPEHIRWAEALMGQAAMAIQNAWLFEQVRASSERLQFLSRRLVEVQENELRYIAQELHDEVGQALTSLVLGLQLIEKDASHPERISAEAEEMGRVLESAMENLHRLAMDLRPAALDQLGLEAALRQHIKTVSHRYGLDIRFEMIGLEARLAGKAETALYRIVQEALNNIVRHANANRVDILIQTRDHCLILIVEDNGIGFDPETDLKIDRLGIFGMRERAEMLGGNLTIESSAGKGTTVLVEVPYENANSHR